MATQEQGLSHAVVRVVGVAGLLGAVAGLEGWAAALTVALGMLALGLLLAMLAPEPPEDDGPDPL
jgi:hypothetical protein